ncbi:cell adhesion molecule 1-like [Homalodisca vitripennis]|uniref:cell adhesion molecule 1-like n=1 Tax=Homalodisca vitripennis TaxID=197043 RepID=UPI001EEBB274|nr:cell adhesion molecule 1-like [Homalodisca vitripennis]
MKEELFKFMHGLLALAVLLAPQDSECLKLIKVKVPAYKLKGETAVLQCVYEMEGLEKLYTVKWYRENEEFYRYVPKYKPSQISYKVEGIRVDHQMSDDTKVTLKSVSLKTTANYRCEVSAEAPSFASVQGSGRLEVVILPSSGPHITGERSHYMIGDEIDLNCTSGKSYPASELRWLINDQEVTEPEYLQRHPQIVHPHGLITTALGLRLPAVPGHFHGGSMKVRCVANVSPVLWQGDRESVVETPLVANREAMLLVRSAANIEHLCPSALTFLILLIVIT